MTNTVVLYPRGFLGFDIGLAARDPNTSLDQILSAIKFNRPVPKQGVIASNHDVDDLWRDYTTNTKYVTQAQFRDKILIAALRAFGTDDFREWCAIQERSPFFTDMHRRFLNDTFSFIVHGVRSMNVMSWQNLVEYQEATHKDREVRLDYKDMFCEPDLSGRAASPVSYDGVASLKPLPALSNVIHFWVAKEGGFEDLIASLYILFGSAATGTR